MSDVTRILCAGAVVMRDDGRLLVIRRGHAPSAGLWSIPGGRVEPGESLEDAARREVQEETGLTVTIGAVLGRTDIPADRDLVYDVTDFAAVVDGDPDAVRPGDDAADARWVTREQFDQLDVTATLPPALAEWAVWE